MSGMDALSPPAPGRPPPEWRVEAEPVAYDRALQQMEERAAAIAAHAAPELIWLLEHPPVITGGTSADHAELLDAGRFPVTRTGRGGRYTYHGPGQRVIYVLLDLAARGRDVRRYVQALENWAIGALAEFGVSAFTSDAGVGIWVRNGAGDAKIGAIGVRVRRWVTLHGMAINVSTDLSAYDVIVPCGIPDRGVTRLADLVPGVYPEQLDAALRRTCGSFLAAIAPQAGLGPSHAASEVA